MNIPFKENAPPSKDILMKADNPAWKEFSMKPSIKYVLRALGNLLFTIRVSMYVHTYVHICVFNIGKYVSFELDLIDWNVIHALCECQITLKCVLIIITG